MVATRPIGEGTGVRSADRFTRVVGAGPDTAPASPGGMPTVYVNCASLTKDGQPCQARPVGGTKFCIGHTRAQEAKGE